MNRVKAALRAQDIHVNDVIKTLQVLKDLATPPACVSSSVLPPGGLTCASESAFHNVVVFSSHPMSQHRPLDMMPYSLCQPLDVFPPQWMGETALTIFLEQPNVLPGIYKSRGHCFEQQDIYDVRIWAVNYTGNISPFG